MSTETVLVVEDEPPLRRFLVSLLEQGGYRVVEAERAQEAQALAQSHNPALILLDLGLPDADGLTVLESVRGWSRVPVVILSARGDEMQKVGALDAGADDYLTKPFGPQELLARVRLALRHRLQREVPEPVLETGELRIDLEARRVTLRGEEVHLSPLAYRLLAALARQAGKVVTHRQLLTEVWGPAQADQVHYLRIYMGQLRHKLEDDPARPRYLQTEPGVGYRLAMEA